MARPVISLAAARIRRRGTATVLSIASVAAATALVAVVAGSGLIAADATLARALATTGAERPAIRVSAFSSSSRDASDTAATTARILEGVEPFADPVQRGVLYHQLVDRETPLVDLVVGVDELDPWLTLTEGRAPAPCRDGMRCEAVLLSREPTPEGFAVGVPAEGMALMIVGRGQLDPAIPFGDLDQSGPVGDRPGGGQYQTTRASPAVLLVHGVAAIADSPALATTGRTYIWTAPVDVGAIHPWTAAALDEAVEATALELRTSGSRYTLTSPAGLVQDELVRAHAAAARLLLIGSLGVAILLAFAVFLALVGRGDVAAELARLTAVGGTRRDRLSLLVTEAAVPALIGGAIGWVAGGAIVGALAGATDVDPWTVIRETLLAPGTLAAMVAVLVVATAATVVASAPGVRLAGPALVGLGAAGSAVLILGWQLASEGALGAAALARSLASPLVVLLPPVVAFLLALAFVALLPPVLRAVARRTRRAPLPLRLSLLSISREPARPAATMTLLAFSLGAIVFALGWSASLRQGIDDAAAYRSGLDLRVTELGTGLSISSSVVPVERYRRLGDDVELLPVYRDATSHDPGGRVELLGLPPAALPGLPGWRADFSDIPGDELARRLELPAPVGGWSVAGHRLDPAATRLVIPMDYSGARLRLDAVVVTPDGDSTVVRMGDVDDAMREVSAPLPDGARGGVLTALVFRNPGLVAGSGHQDELRRATVRFVGLDGLTGPGPHELEIFTTSSEIIRAPQPTDGLRLPAVVSPDLAAIAGPDGSLDLQVGGDGIVPLRVVGTADRMPTVVDERPRFVVVSLEPWLVALASAVPGSGRPNEMWIAVEDPGRRAEVRAALAEEPFRFATVTERAALVAERAEDPLSRAVLWTLLASALAGLALSVGGLLLGTVTDLRDERGELADLEAQGVPPSALRWQTLARTAWLAGAGAAAGVVVGIVLTTLTTAALSVTADGATPIPPLAIVIPVLPIALAVAGLVLGLLVVAAWLVGRAYGRATLGERRAAVPGEAGLGWRPSGEAGDG